MVSLDPTIIAAAIVTVIASLTAAAVTIINAVSSARNRKISNNKQNEIHDLVNGSATLAAEKLKKLEDQLILVQKQLIESQEKRVTEAKRS